VVPVSAHGRSAHGRSLARTALAEVDPGVLTVGVAAFAAVELALAIWMTVAPRSFFTSIGPFSDYNPHYIRDVATFEAALGVGLLVAVREHSWRVPALGITLVQFALHSVNHLVDIGNSHPAWAGYFDFFALAGATLQLGWLFAAARAASSQTTKGALQR
jgi:Na+-transporting NADH:ubiquinone oxidoreductase subunit NqrB